MDETLIEGPQGDRLSWRRLRLAARIAGPPILSAALRAGIAMGVRQAYDRLVSEDGREADAIGAIGLGLGYRVRSGLLFDPDSGEPVNEEEVLRRAVGDAGLAAHLIFLNDRARLPLEEIAAWLESIGL